MTQVERSDALAKFHQANIERAVRSRAESDWHDFKQFASNDGKIDEFLKDFAALANTPGGPYEGYGYIIIGVVDKTFELVGLKGKDATVNVDERTNQLSNMISKGIAPYLEFSVFDHVVDEKRVQCIVIPEASGSWHLVTSDKHSGFWIRRGFASVRPTYQDFENHQRRMLQRELTPLQEQITSLELRLGTQRELLQDLQQQRDPENEPAAHRVSRQLQTPEHSVLASVRSELLAFMDGHTALMYEMERFQPDRLLSLPDDRTPERISALRELVERIETLTRPTVETVARLIHADRASPLIPEIIREIADAFAERAYTPLAELPALSSLRTYHVQLLLYGAATASFLASDLTLFGLVMHHSRNDTALRVQTARLPLAALLNRRGPLDRLMSLLNDGSIHQATVERMENLLLQSDWVGGTLPITNRRPTFSRAEALLTLGYVATFLHRMTKVPSSPDPAWWRYTGSAQILEDALIRLQQSGTQLLRRADIAGVAAEFDDLEKPLTTQLQIKADELLYIQNLEPE